MTASMAIFNNAADNTAFSAPRALSGPASNSSSTDTGADITSNDFLTLLVTEMKNQDPTSAQDPNQYVNQLVSVNSLQQLIQINETLSSAAALTTVAQPGTGSHASGSIPVTQPHAQPQPIHGGSGTQVISGNLSIPATTPAAHRIANVLSSHTSRR